MENKRPVLLSIIVPAYNVESYIRECLDSVFDNLSADNENNVEVIVINDGSLDGTLDIVREYNKEHPLILIDQKSTGVSNARICGMRVASGKYLMFVDSDDYLVGNLFADFADKLVSDLDLVVFSYYNSFEEDLTEKSRSEKSLPFKGNYDKDGFIKIFKELFLSDMLYTVWNKIYRREFLLENNLSFEQYELGEDVRFNLDVYREVNKIYLSQDSYYVYVIGRKGSAMSGYNPKRLQYQLQELKMTDNLLSDWNLDSSELVNTVKARILMSNIYNITKQNLSVNRKVKLIKDTCERQEIEDFIKNDSSALNPLIKLLLKCRMYVVLIYLKKIQMVLQHL